MAYPLPWERKGGQRSVLREDGLAVFDGKVVVGLFQQGGKTAAGAERLHSRLPCGGKIPCAARKFGFEGGAVVVAQEELGGVHEKGDVRRLGSEHQRVAPGGSKKTDACPGKGFGSGAGAGGGKREHKVGSAGQGGADTDFFGQEGKGSPLGQPAAHRNGHPLGPQCFGLRDLPCVAVVERIVFGNDTSESHKGCPFLAAA